MQYCKKYTTKGLQRFKCISKCQDETINRNLAFARLVTTYFHENKLFYTVKRPKAITRFTKETN